MRFSTDIYNTFRPTDEGLSAREEFQIQAYRLLFVLGTGLNLLHIPLYAVASPDAVDPLWARLGVSALFAGSVVVSYLFEEVRRHYAWVVMGVIAIVTGWILALNVLNGFASDYEIGLLLLHSIFTVLAGIGVQSIRPVVWFSVGSLAATVGVIVGSGGSLLAEAVLLGAMGTASLVIGLGVQRLIVIRDELEERESRLRGLANSVPGVVFQFYARADGTWGHHFVSEHAEDVLGISSVPDGFLKRIGRRIPASHRQRILRSIRRAVANRETWRVEFPFETPSGERIWLLGTATLQERGGKVVYNGFLLDITERKHAEQALRASKEEAEKTSQVKTAMLANMSHEVRTPLTSILGFSELLESNLEGHLQKFAQRTHESSHRLLETLESVLQLSKLEAGATRLSREEVELRSVVEDTVGLLEPRAGEKSIVVDVRGPEEPVVGDWNENAIGRISRNLIENAIKFTPAGGRVEVGGGGVGWGVEEEGDDALLWVEDTGIGIEESHIPEIFQAFRQESEGIRKEYQGSGLGLSIVDHLVKEFGGTIEVSTEKGEGTCFRVRVPLSG